MRALRARFIKRRLQLISVLCGRFSMDRSRVRTRLIMWLPPAVALGLWVLASLATGIYYGDTRAISYPTPLSAELLWSHRGSLSFASLRSAWSTGLYDWTFLVTVFAWPLLLSRRTHIAACVAGALPLALLFPVNLLGAYMSVIEVLFWPQWDGETLAEGWPLVELYGLWSLWALVFIVGVLRGRMIFGRPVTVLAPGATAGAA